MQKLSMDELNRPDVESFKSQTKTPIVIILDNVRSMHNVGSAFRTADGFAIEKIVLCGITATPPHREIEKTALGATQSVVWEYVQDTTEAIHALKEDGYMILAIEQANGSTELQAAEVDSAQKYAFIFGNEVHGVSDEAMRDVDACLEIPQFGTKHSFNVSVTVGIVVWHFVQKLKLF
ncbi:RNA methyltransferase [Sphingobacterium paludis]|uniref:SpoU rRNA methylase family protein n=1 Tax=Sphingobacterium paludis TaxID=1476465 RepID=A0A4R7CVJ8_9SPHI|nr:RNA methyltransferase [Sphingobacterium paludis]TDS12503.1 SpoU rRNA methylase family protein [Sphingobacterium paludis]